MSNHKSGSSLLPYSSHLSMCPDLYVAAGPFKYVTFRYHHNASPLGRFSDQICQNSLRLPDLVLEQWPLHPSEEQVRTVEADSPVRRLFRVRRLPTASTIYSGCRLPMYAYCAATRLTAGCGRFAWFVVRILCLGLCLLFTSELLLLLLSFDSWSFLINCKCGNNCT